VSTPTPKPGGGHPEIDPALVENGAELRKHPQAAGEPFVHGLLSSYHHDSIGERERRLARLMDAIRSEGSPPLRVRFALPWRIASGLAAAAVLAIGLVLIGLPTQSATAMVQTSLAASKTAGDRRYEVRMTPPGGTEVQAEPTAVLDVRDPDHVVLRAKTPFGDQVIVGRNSDGAWAIRPDGTLDRYPPREAWPRWLNCGQSTMLMASVDDLMQWLEKSYILSRSAAEAVPAPAGAASAAPGPTCDRVSAVHKPGRTPEPQHVELWIDQQTHVVRRMELTWPPRPGPGPGQGPGAEPGRRGGPPLGPGPRPDGGPSPLRPRNDDGLGPPLRRGPEGRPGRRPPPPAAPEGDDRPGPPPGEDDRPPPPPRPPHPRPEFMGGPPDFDAGRHPPPPRKLVFDLVDSPQLAADWFDAAAHKPE
jgi:hypothetical protein